MNYSLSLIATLLLSPGCVSPLDPAAVQAAEVYFPPRFKYVAEPQYCFSPAECKHALLECAKRKADTLFEFVVDSDGKVKKARLVKTQQPSDHEEVMLEHARVMVFSADAESKLYRCFYFPVKYTYSSDFKWSTD